MIAPAALYHMHEKIIEEFAIFYVDDDEDDRIIFEEILEEIAPNAHVEMFKSGRDLLNAVENPPPFPAVVFVDLNMPGLTGFDVMKQIRKSPVFNKLPLIVLSTSDDEQSFEQSKLNGANSYIVKSGDITQLKDSLYSALNTKWQDFRAEGDQAVIHIA